MENWPGGLMMSVHSRDVIRIIQQSDFLDAELDQHRDVLGDLYDGYRAHLYRVLSFALWHLDGDETHRQIIEYALVFHDLGLASQKTVKYLEPSIDLALAANAKRAVPFPGQLLRDIIYFHHKFRAWSGPNANIVNAVRKGDWVDATQGAVKMGLPTPLYEQVTNAIPVGSFFDDLNRLGAEYSGGKVAMLRDLMVHVIKF